MNTAAATDTPGAEALLAQGNPAAALQALQQQVRANAADVRPRIFLFQLLALLGQWARAQNQLSLCGELDAGTLAMVNTYGPALQCELLREAVFAGRATPHVFGPPAAWVAHLAQALVLQGQGQAAQAAQARALALEEAPASAGTLDNTPFEWITDADSRLGPVLEVVINGRYGWLPFAHLAEVSIEPVADLRDLIWAPAHLTFANGADTVALLPARYVGSAHQADAALQMARKTEWLPLHAGVGEGIGEGIGKGMGEGSAGASQYQGLGQRLLATSAADQGLLAVRRIVFTPPLPDPA